MSDLVCAAAPLLYVFNVIAVLPSPQGHAKSLLDAVKTYAFASVLEGFWPKRPGNQRPRPPQSLVHLLISSVLARFWACKYTHSRPPVVVALLHRTLNNVAAYIVALLHCYFVTMLQRCIATLQHCHCILDNCSTFPTGARLFAR